MTRNSAIALVWAVCALFATLWALTLTGDEAGPPGDQPERHAGTERVLVQPAVPTTHHHRVE